MTFKELFDAVAAELGPEAGFSIKVDASRIPARRADPATLVRERSAHSLIDWSIYVRESGSLAAIVTDDYTTPEAALAELRVEIAKARRNLSPAGLAEAGIAAVGAPHLGDDGSVQS